MLHIDGTRGAADKGVTDDNVMDRVLALIRVEIKGDRVRVIAAVVEDILENNVSELRTEILTGAAGFRGYDSVNVIIRVYVAEIRILHGLV